jgi:hypothetical protein
MRSGVAAAAAGAALLLTAGSASAATMTVSPPEEATVGTAVTWRVEGTTESSSTLLSYVEKDGIDCESSAPRQKARPGVSELPTHFPAPGAFSLTQSFTPPEITQYRVCSYLYFIADDEATAIPRFIATMVFTPGEPAGMIPGGSLLPVPPRLSGPPRQRIGTKRVLILASCEEDCRLVSSGRSGRVRVRAKTVSAPAGRQVRLIFKLPATTVASMKRQLEAGRKINFKAVVTARFGSGDSVTARRTVRIVL